MRTRSSEVSYTTSSTYILPRICIFCRHVRSSKMEYFGASMMSTAETLIRVTAILINDTKLLSFIGHYCCGNGRDFVALEAKYHHSCRKHYVNKLRGPTSNRRFIRSTIAFNKIVKHINDSIITNKPKLLSSLFVKYKDFYVLTGGEESDLECYTSQNLKKRLLRKFDSTKLSIANHRRKDGKNPSVVFKPGMSVEKAYSHQFKNRE